MKIFATSDIHGNTALMEKMLKVATNVDLVLYCGDVANAPANATVQMADVDNLMHTFEKLPCSARFIRGNCDNFTSDSPFYLTRPETIGGILFVPFESILTTPFGTFREVNEDRMKADLTALGDCRHAVIVAHNPPHGAGDEIPGGIHVGSKSIAEWIESESPKAWLCGHVHEGFGKFGNVFNCASDAANNVLRGWVINLETMDCDDICV